MRLCKEANPRPHACPGSSTYPGRMLSRSSPPARPSSEVLFSVGYRLPIVPVTAKVAEHRAGARGCLGPSSRPSRRYLVGGFSRVCTRVEAGRQVEPAAVRSRQLPLRASSHEVAEEVERGRAREFGRIAEARHPAPIKVNSARLQVPPHEPLSDYRSTLSPHDERFQGGRDQ